MPEKMANALPLQRNYKSQEFSAETTQSAIQKLTPWQREVATYTCATKNPELGIFWTRKETNCKTCLEIFMIFCFFVCILGGYFHKLKTGVYFIVQK